MASTSAPPAPLMCVQVALRADVDAGHATTARTQVAALPHVVRAISDCLDYQFWTLPRACAANLLSLLPRIVAWGAAHGVDPHYWRFQCGRGLVYAVQHDNLAMVEWLHDHCPSILPYAAMVEAAGLGNLPMLQWLVERHDPPQLPAVLDAAASAGQLETARWLHAQGYVFTRDGFSGMLRGGHYDVLVLLFDDIPGNLDGDSLYLDEREVAMSGDTRIPALFLDDEWCGMSLGRVLLHALAKGDVDMAEWCCTARGITPYVETYAGLPAVALAAGSGSLQAVQWCMEHYPDQSTKSAMDYAAGKGHLHIVQWLHANRMDGCTTWAMDEAASGGHVDVVRWLHDHRTEGCTSRAMDGAASNGHMELLEWLAANRTEGCTTQAMEGAARNGCLDAMQWLHENRTEGCTNWTMDRAAREGHLDVIKWLHANRTVRCTTQAMDGAAEMGHLDVVRWLHENRSEGYTEGAMRDAVDGGYMDVVLYLHSIGSPGYNGCLNIAAGACELHFEIVQWLLAMDPGLERDCHANWRPYYVRDMMVKHLENLRGTFGEY